MNSQQCLTTLSGLSTGDQALVSQYGRGPSLPVPHSLIHQAFEGVVDNAPTAIAAKFGKNTITYQQLDIAANRLAHHLIESGLQPKQRVCLVVQRSLEMLIGILAILKAGCQYVPVDGGVVSEQALQHIITDTETRFVLCLPQFWDKVRRFSKTNTIIVALGMDVGAFYSNERPKIDISLTDGAYAIYTSGSTGKPKGVDVSHGNVTNALLLKPANLGITIGTRVAQVLNIAFDLGAWEILGCLMNGGTLHMRGSDWVATLQEIETLISTPSILSHYRRKDFPNIKTIVTGGEPCPQSLADEWAEGSCYYNICGPTEVTILNSAHQHIPGQSLSIGKPLPNTSCYVLDDDESPVPVGSKGLMWVGGAGVSRGYINLPELTSDRYKSDKFANDGSLMFNTGDIVRWREDGSLETFGRNDDQVKIKKFPGIARASAMVVENVFHGFYTAQIRVDEKELDAFIRQHLPYYSVPDKLNYVTAIPLTHNGKVNKNKLIALCPHVSREDSAADLTPAPMSNALVATKDLKRMAAPLPLTNSSPITSGDSEKGSFMIPSIMSDLKSPSSDPSIADVPEILPIKNGIHGQRWLRYRAFILYRRFMSIVVLGNVAVACFLIYQMAKKSKWVLGDIATATASNLCMAVLMRSEPVVNFLFTVFSSVPTWLPLFVRRECAKIYHIGGIHSGCAIAATTWFAIFTVGASIELAKAKEERRISLAPTVLSYLILVILVTMGSMSYAKFRAKHHNIWETTHRFGGWTVLILLWTQTFLATKDLSPGVAPSKAYLHSPSIWLLTVASMAVIFPWIFLRKVAIRSEVLSTHAARLWFDYATPVPGSAVRLAERPLVDWHGFATIANPNGKGFSVIVSRAGDFTGRTIERAPTHIWVRGMPTCGVMRVNTLFRSVVLVATGSGIGPCLPVILAKKVSCRVLWTAPNPEQTFGKEIVNNVLERDPRAVIWNTRTMGKPNMSLLAYKLWKESGAEAVIIISNKRFTTEVVYALETRGVPAYGAIFDS
ncbi:gramicidin S synthetase 1 [Dothidotthia symphoricarpi CBS 119687]|uniref:Gramicidin S synthetase 1 n=1 Tax=Dothidotthia symphoricarpi CBS 119687 TaxID=1392245 RepID=A0A6A6AGJ6_9PLEO|nr:gramicidin S synthetase 1 [Dothidotthia symphoricarpi CBS 119687]KAF2130168.1 gramicidin S synthetase 1 [Dothidotthia symphoricarpi CBS 119687]